MQRTELISMLTGIEKDVKTDVKIGSRFPGRLTEEGITFGKTHSPKFSHIFSAISISKKCNKINECKYLKPSMIQTIKTCARVQCEKVVESGYFLTF